MPRLLSSLPVACALLAALPAAALDKNTLLEALETSSRLQALEMELEDIRAQGGNKDAKKQVDHNIREEKKNVQHALAECRTWFTQQKGGADVNWQDKKGRTILMLAAASGNPAAVEMVLAENPRLDILDKNGHSALDYEKQAKRGTTLQNHLTTKWQEAFANDDMEALKPLLEAGLSPETIVGDEAAPVFAIRTMNNELLQLLASYGPPSPRCRSQEGMGLLELAIHFGNAEALRILLAAGVKGDTPFENGTTPLTHLVTHGDAACLNAYLTFYTGMDEAARKAVPSLVARYGTVEMVRANITGEEQANIEDAQMNIPVHEAARRGDMEILRHLLDQGGRRDAHNGAGESTLMHAALSGNPEALSLVLEGLPEKELTHKDKEGRRALDYARESGSAECVSLLEEATQP